MALTKTYLDNEFLDEHDRRLFEEMKQCFPRRYYVEGLGQWGIASGLVYENWRVEAFDWKDLAMRRTESRILCGLDFGFTHDPRHLLYVWWTKGGGKSMFLTRFIEKQC